MSLRLKKTGSPRRRSEPRRSAAPPSAGGSPSPPVPDDCYREMVELALVGVYRSTPEGRFLFANGALAKILGYESVEEVLALDIPRDVFLDPADRNRLIAEYGQASRIAKIEVVLKRKDGSPVPVQLDARVVRDAGGSILYFEGFVHDITEQKRAEQALRESEERHRLILSNIDEIVYMVEIENGNPLESRVRFVSEGVERVAGYPVEDFLRDPGLWLRAVHPEDLCAVEQATRRIFESGRGGIREYRFRHGKTGAYIWIEDHVIPRLDDSGRKAAVLGVARDITDRKRAEDRVERSLPELRALSARLQNIREEEAARIARQVHDEIGQSLTALAMDVEWLTTNLGRRSSKTALSSKLQSMAQLVEATTEAVQRIASDLRPGVLDELGLGPAAEWAVRRFEERTGIAFRLHSHLDGAQIDSARATAAFRILQEALTNVARHSRARRVEVRLSIRGPELHLEIQDDGVGIDTERTADFQSLGLVGMRERARVFGGSVAVAPASGGGTLVSAAIPLRGPGRIV